MTRLATPAALGDALASLRDARTTITDVARTATADLADAQHDRQVLATENGALRDELDELRRRADAVAAMWRAKRIAVYSLTDIAELNALAEAVPAEEARRG